MNDSIGLGWAIALASPLVVCLIIVLLAIWTNDFRRARIVTRRTLRDKQMQNALATLGVIAFFLFVPIQGSSLGRDLLAFLMSILRR